MGGVGPGGPEPIPAGDLLANPDPSLCSFGIGSAGGEKTGIQSSKRQTEENP